MLLSVLLAFGADAAEHGLDEASSAALDSAIDGQHRSAENKARDKYRRPAEKAGFEFAARSDHNRNRKDRHEHPQGVWTLLPTLALGDEGQQKYLAIGESDRLTINFVKPAAN